MLNYRRPKTLSTATMVTDDTPPATQTARPRERVEEQGAPLPARGALQEGAERAWLRSYGRRRGRAASARQSALLADLLPHVAISLAEPPPARLTDLFAAAVKDAWLEIGFGGGEHLSWQAKRNPAVGIIGCEPFRDGIIKALAAIEADRLGNVRLFADDARPLLDWLPAGSIGRTFILFPDPWPKKRHHKRRLIGKATLTSLARVMRRGSELRMATDIAAYAAAMLSAVRHQGDFEGEDFAEDFAGPAWSTAGGTGRPPDWPETRYEQKARDCGRTCHFFSLRRR
jgi:tRNA (guanine-N7-)-methyltransferase